MPSDDKFLSHKGINEALDVSSVDVDDYIIPIFNKGEQKMYRTDLSNVASTVQVGFWDYNDLATATTPINVSADTDTVATNDGLGTFTNKAYALAGITDIYDTSTNSFDWTQISLGDTVEIRIDLEITTSSNNQDVTVSIELGSGGGAYQIPFISDVTFKQSGTHRITGFEGIYMGDTNTLNGGGQIIVNTDSSATLKVNGWYVRVIKR